MSNTNVYEVGMLDTYEKYKKGYIVSKYAKEYEEIHKGTTEKLDEILTNAKERKDFVWLNEIQKIKEDKKPSPQGEGR